MTVPFIAEMFGEYGPVSLYSAVPIAYGVETIAASVYWVVVLGRTRKWTSS